MNGIDYLLESNDYFVRYNTLLNLKELPSSNEPVIKAKNNMLLDVLIIKIVDELKYWDSSIISSHKSAGQLYHKLVFLSDIGITRNDLGMASVIDTISKERSPEGLIQLSMNVSTSYGGTGSDTKAWALCDAPLLLYATIKMNGKINSDDKRAIDYLVNLSFENGWHCETSKELGGFRGPGRKGDPCPYATLIMLKLLTLCDEYKNSAMVENGINSLLNLWENSKTIHPYMFYMGTDFRKLKVPFIWYDIVNVVDVLSHYDIAIKDKRFKDMLNMINDKKNNDGLYTPESVWKAWSEFDFGQKNEPSMWLTYVVYNINKRVSVY